MLILLWGLLPIIFAIFSSQERKWWLHNLISSEHFWLSYLCLIIPRCLITSSLREIQEYKISKLSYWCVRWKLTCLKFIHMYSRWFSFLLFPLSYTCLMLLQFLELWNPFCQSSITQSCSAHTDIITSLAGSPLDGTIASVSHDQWIKIWAWRFFVDQDTTATFFLLLSKLHHYLNEWVVRKALSVTNFRHLFQTLLLYFIIWKLIINYMYES